MEFKSSNQPAANRPVGQAAELRPASSNSSWKPERSKTPMVLIAVLVVLLVLVGLGTWMWKSAAGGDAGIKKNQYQALFLTNGQVYFGKLADANDHYVRLSNIYYLQVQQTVQPEEKKDAKEQQPQVSLAKLGSELHGPEDEMRVNRDQVLFWENLKDDSKVVKAINEALNKK